MANSFRSEVEFGSSIVIGDGLILLAATKPAQLQRQSNLANHNKTELEAKAYNPYQARVNGFSFQFNLKQHILSVWPKFKNFNSLDTKAIPLEESCVFALCFPSSM